MTSEAALDALAHQMGVEVTTHRTGPKGLWIPARRAITLRADLGHVQRRCTLAHELGHAHHDDPAHAHNHWAWVRQERRADEYAARTLITAEHYQQAEQLAGPHPGAIAYELGVTRHLVTTWRALHQRTTT